MSDVTTIAASGMAAAMRTFNTQAATIVNADSSAPPGARNAAVIHQPTTLVQGMLSDTDTGTAMVGMAEAANSFRANLAVFRAGAQMFKTLLDTVA